MSTYSAVAAKAARKPPRKVVLTPSAFADTWSGKPESDVALGLRLISEAEVQAAKAQAEAQVVRWYTDHESGQITGAEGANDAYNDAVMRHCVARATCDVNDVDKPYFEMAEDTVREALTPEGVRRLYEELTILHATSSVAIALADDDEVHRLARVLADGRAIAALSGSERIEVRKMLGVCLSLLVATGQAHEKAFAGEDGDGGYVVRSADG